MECRQVNELLSAYIDGMLSEETASMVKEHLDRCPQCLDAYETMRRIIEQMHRMEAVEEPEDFIERVRERLGKRSAVKEFSRHLFVPLRVKLPLEVAALAAALALVFYLAGIVGHATTYEIEIAMGLSPHQEAVETMMDKRAPEKTLGDRAAEMRTGAKGTAPEGVKKGGEVGESPLQAALHSAGARVIESEYREASGRPSEMIVEIRADRYHALLEALGGLGTISGSVPTISEEGDELIRIRIIFSNR